MTITAWSQAASLFAPKRQWTTPGELEATLDFRTIQTPALDLIDAALVKLADAVDGRLIITMPPQEGKSSRVQAFVVWWLKQHPDHRVILASYGDELAVRNGRAIRRRITDHPDVLDLHIREDNGAVKDWTLRHHEGGVLSVGIGAGVTGRPADVLVIDDPIKNQSEADSEAFRNTVWDWWETVGSARLAPGAPVVLVLTRWHEDDLAGRLLASENGSEWQVLNIPAEADHDPAKGETDPLDRQPGEFMQSARGRTHEQWLRRKREAGSRAWAALYQGRPSRQAGNILKADWWQLYHAPMWTTLPDGRCVVNIPASDVVELVQSWDMAFKDTKGSDYVVGQVWLRVGNRVYLLDQVRGRWDFTETCRQLRALSVKWPQATAKLVEDKANGPAVINALKATVMGLIPVEPEGSKIARVHAVAPLTEAGHVFLPAPATPDGEPFAPWQPAFIEEAKGFPNAAHDDQVDCYSQAVHRLLLVPMLEAQTVTSDDLVRDEILYDLDAGLSPY